jgi:hypothetical protein
MRNPHCGFCGRTKMRNCGIDPKLRIFLMKVQKKSKKIFKKKSKKLSSKKRKRIFKSKMRMRNFVFFSIKKKEAKTGTAEYFLLKSGIFCGLR